MRTFLIILCIIFLSAAIKTQYHYKVVYQNVPNGERRPWVAWTLFGSLLEGVAWWYLITQIVNAWV